MLVSQVRSGLFVEESSTLWRNVNWSKRGWGEMRSYWRGALGSLVLQIWPALVRFFSVSHFKRETAVFRFWCLARFAGFVQCSLWFLVFVNNDGGFSLILLFRARRFSFFPFLARSLLAGYRFFCPMHFTVFLVLPWKLYPTVALKLQFFWATYMVFYPFF